MPELPDITVYVERIATKTESAVLRELRLHDAFVLRTAVPPVASLNDLRVVDVRRLGKRVVLGFAAAGEAMPSLFLVIHLMIAGRLHWLATGKKPPGHALATLVFDDGLLVLTEAGKRRRASLHVGFCVTRLTAVLAAQRSDTQWTAPARTAASAL